MKKLVDQPGFSLVASTIEDGDFATPRSSASAREIEVYEARLLALCARAGMRSPRAVRVARLVHGNVVGSVWSPRSTFEFVDNIDGLVTSNRDVALVVTGADCPPILAVSQFASCIGLAHSGRDGTLKNIARELVNTMLVHVPYTPLDLWIGPGICGNCYRVNAEIIKEFAAYRDAETRPGSELLDLTAVIESQLRSVIHTGNFQRVGGCTREQPDMWHSFRRDTESGLRLTRPRVQAFVAMMAGK